MINANELRIGNLLIPTRPRHNEKYVIVNQINFEEINSDFREYPLVDLNPIPLTEEILLKSVFEKIREYFTIDNEFDIFKDKKGYYAHINCGNIYITSLHQLQNLYFALTGQELEINL